MSTDKFFNEMTEQSLVKTTIVSKYFWVWAKVIISSAKRYGRPDRIAYIDLFAGPGRYEDGTVSTPLKVLGQAIEDEDMQKMLVTHFNDVDADNSRALQQAINQLPGIEKLKYRPAVDNEEIGSEIADMFESMKMVPTLFFVDPWGYKGLSVGLVNSVVKDWGSDCIFFFNYNRINMGIRNPRVVKHMNVLFGEERADVLREELEPLSPEEREATIVEALSAALNETQDRHVLPFRFKHPSQGRTSHHLIFVTKHVRGLEIMKEIMAKESSSSDQGVPSFEYNPAILKQGLLFELARPLDDLKKMLLQGFAGKTLTMKQVYDQHHPCTKYIKKNYKDVLKMLENEGRIVANPAAANRKKGTFADRVLVTFPKTKGV